MPGRCLGLILGRGLNGLQAHRSNGNFQQGSREMRKAVRVDYFLRCQYNERPAIRQSHHRDRGIRSGFTEDCRHLL